VRIAPDPETLMATRDLILSSRRSIPARVLDVQVSRAGGPGGQHVNKTSTKIDLRVDLNAVRDLFRDDEWERIQTQLGSRLDKDGRLMLTSSETRSQETNLDAALARAESLLKAALVPPKARKKTRPSKGSKERRLKAKRQNSERKQSRNFKYDG